MVCVVCVPCPSMADGMSAYCDSFYYETAKTPAAKSQEDRRSLLVLVQAPVTATRGDVCTLFGTRVRGQEAGGDGGQQFLFCRAFCSAAAASWGQQA